MRLEKFVEPHTGLRASTKTKIRYSRDPCFCKHVGRGQVRLFRRVQSHMFLQSTSGKVLAHSDFPSEILAGRNKTSRRRGGYKAPSKMSTLACRALFLVVEATKMIFCT